MQNEIPNFLNRFPKQTKRDKVRSAKRRRKYNAKCRKWALSIIRRGSGLICGTATKCLDCGSIKDNTRLGCSCWTPSKPSKGIVYGVNLVIEIGNGIKTPMAKKTEFLSIHEFKDKLSNKFKFYDLSSKNEILLNNI